MHKKICTVSALLAAALLLPASSYASNPEEDLKDFRNHYYERFPDTPKQDFINGVYSIDADSRIQWENMEEFPVYEDDIAIGEELFNTPFANGKTYADCLKDGGVGTRQMYPYFDSDSGEIVTLESAINACRTENGEKPLKWKKGPLAQISAYIAYTSRGNKFDLKIPDDERAMAAYERGKRHYYMKRGQLNLACADCHYYSTGTYARSELLSPSLGHITGFPVFRHQKWGQLGTLHRRLGGCNANIRAKPFAAQSDEYKALEYFLTYMSNGLEVNGPSSRK
jgi:sulfur-oxidizing protein SoxA